MANKKFSEFVLKTDTSDVSHIVGYNGAENVQITPANFVTTGGTGVFLPLAGGTMTGDINHNDNVKSTYGNGNDLQIYHDGTDSYIKELTSGSLKIWAKDFEVYNAGGTETLINADVNGGVQLFFDNTQRFATTSTGIGVTGDGTFSGDVIADTHFNSSDSNVTLSTTGAGNVFLRPNGKSDTTGQVLVNQSGELKIDSADATLILKGSDTGSSLINFSDASDGNVGRIYYDHQNNFMQFKTNDSERMRLDSSGKLGLGVNTNISGTITMPNSGLISFHDANGQGRNSLQFVSGELKHGAAGSGLTTQTFFTDGDERMRLDSSGNLGINDSVGYGKLAIKTSGTFTFDSNDLDYSGVNILMKTTNTATDAVGSGMVWLKGNNVSRKVAAITNYTYGDTDQSGLNFYVQPSAGGSAGVLTEALRITNDGNLGVGTDSPDKKMTIVDTSAGSVTYPLRLQNSGTTAGTNVGLIFTTKNSGGGSASSIIRSESEDTSGNNSLVFTTPSGGSSAERMRIDSDGKLTVSAGSNIASFQSIGSGSNLRKFDISTGGDRVVINAALLTNAATDLAIQTGGTERMRINSAGNVLVGKSTDDDNSIGCRLANFGVVSATRSDNVSAIFGRKTSVGNVVLFRQDGTQVGSISLTASATSYNTSSDYRLKEDLQDFKGLDLVSKIPVYDYKWKADKSRSYGVMAHELEEVLPQAVSGEKDAEEMQSVDYSKIVPLLVKSIQELSAKLEALECQCEKK